MPKSFLIKKRASFTRAGRRAYKPCLDGKGDWTNDELRPCTALNDTSEVIEPLDASVKDDSELGDVVTPDEVDTSVFSNRGHVRLKSTSDPTGTFLFSNPPELPSCDYPIHLPTAAHGGLSHGYYDSNERSLAALPVQPGVGYFSQRLLACKLQTNRTTSFIRRKRHHCPFCAKGFNDKFDLKRHVRTHTGVRPFKCDQCFRAFTQRCSLEVHQRKVHNLELNFAYKQRRDKVYVCEDCGNSTDDINAHYTHSTREHRASLGAIAGTNFAAPACIKPTRIAHLLSQNSKVSYGPAVAQGVTRPASPVGL